MAESNVISPQYALRGSKVDAISTKNNDMKQRRVINAAPAKDSNDYVIKAQVDQSTSNLQSQTDDINNQIAQLNGKISNIGTIPVKNLALYAPSTANLTLTTTYQTVPGTVLTLPSAGTYFVAGVFYFDYSHLDGGYFLEGSNSFNSTYVAVYARGSGTYTEDVFVTASQNWILNIPAAGTTVSLVAAKTGGTGTSAVGVGHTGIVAILIS